MGCGNHAGGAPTSLPARLQQASYQEAHPGGQPTPLPGELEGALPTVPWNMQWASRAGAALLGQL